MTPRKPTRAKALGVTDAEYARLLEAQGGHCALCPNTPKTEHDPVKPWTCRYCRKRNLALVTICAECANPRPKPPRLHTDHDHATIGPDGRYRVRGLLCHRCNRNLPTWVDERWLYKAAAYIGGNKIVVSYVPTYTEVGGSP